ncbi:MAG: hypothetical protein J6T98_13250 [Salinivirgaceae bacterium]|nr:hypothetical protein [Salinivirgaceae bacterium]
MDFRRLLLTISISLTSIVACSANKVDIQHNKDKKTKGESVYQVDYVLQSSIKMVAQYSDSGYISHFDIYSDGAGLTNKIGMTKYEYDQNGRNTKISDIESSGRVRMVMWKEYDENGNYSGKHRQQFNSRLKGEKYEYDSEGRMISKTVYNDGSPWSQDTIIHSVKGFCVDSLGRNLTTDTVVVIRLREGYLAFMIIDDITPELMEKKDFSKSIKFYDKDNNLVKTINYVGSSHDQVSYVEEWVVDEFGDIVEIRNNGNTIMTIEYDRSIPFENIKGFKQVSRSIFDGIIDFTPKHAITNIKRGDVTRMSLSYSKVN